MRFFVYVTLIAALLVSFVPAQAMLADTVVEPANMNGWLAVDDKVDVGGGRVDFMSGPGAAPLNSKGSAHFVIENSNAAWLLASPITPETPLASITKLGYWTYTTNGGASLAVSLQLGIDYDSADAITGWQGRLVYEPYMNGTVTQGIWQEWNAVADGAKWYGTKGDGLLQCPMASPCTWTQIKEKFPRAMFHAQQMHSFIGLKAGSGWATFDGNADALVLGLNNVDTTYDFEPASTVYVDDDWSGVPYGTDPDAEGPAHLMGFDASATVQGGVHLVASGGTVNVAAGTYTEQVIVRDLDGITIQGAGQDVVTIVAPTNMTGATIAGLVRKAVVFVQGSENVTTKNFTVDGAGTGNTNNILLGVAYHNASGRMENLTTKAIRHTPLNGVQGGVGFYVNNEDGTPRTITATGCTAIDYQKGGFVFDRAGLTAIVEKNTAVGVGPTGTIAMNGIQISRGATGTVTGNTVSGHAYTGTSATAAGIILYQASAVVSNNVIKNNQVGISSDLSTFSALRNYISGGDKTLVEYGIAQNGGTSTITGNNITSNDYGIDVYTYESASTPYTAAATIRNNRFFNNDVGVANEIFVYPNQEAPVLDALNNWWSCNEGPTLVPGDCDTKLGPVDTTTWLILTLTADKTHVLNGSPATLTGSITQNNENVVVTEPVLFPDGKSVEFDTTFTLGLVDGSDLPVSKDLVGGSASSVLTVGPWANYETATVSVSLDNETVTLDLLAGLRHFWLPITHGD